MRRDALTLTATLGPPGSKPTYPWLVSAAYREVRCRLQNTSREPITFTTWSCSWYENWATDHPQIAVMHWPCDKNIPVTVRLAPGESYEKAIPLSLIGAKPGTRLTLRFEAGDLRAASSPLEVR